MTSTSTRAPSVGRIVHYTLGQYDVARVNQNRVGEGTRSGNPVHEGDVYPMIITRVWGTTPESAVQGQVFLDGKDNLWVTSVTVGEGAGHFFWPVIA